METSVDLLWVLMAAALVLLMQAVFLMMEAGLTRSKNSISVAQKNMADFAVSAVSYGAIGFAIMFGPTLGGWAGLGWDFIGGPGTDPGSIAFFVFQVMFAGTCATIVSGAVAERMSFVAYLVAIPAIGGVIYPIFGHWVWGGYAADLEPGWLQALGFVDFAGSTVVHSAGGWLALAAALIVGPRLGRFAADGTPTRLQGHSPILAGLGVMLLFVGWLGFNGGSVLAVNDLTVLVFANTICAATAGATAGMALGYLRDRTFLPERLFLGLLGGLVGVTAGCATVAVSGAIMLGALGGLSAVYSERLLERWKIDDVVGAIPVHGFAGLVGTVALPVFALPGSFGETGILAQVGIQALGAGAAFLWFFGTGYVLFSAINIVLPMRVSAEHEKIGLNQSEHGSIMGLGLLESRLLDVLAGKNVEGRIELEPGDDAYDLGEMFNTLLDRIRQEREGQRYRLEQDRIVAEGQRADALRLAERAEKQRAIEAEVAGEIAQVIRGIKDQSLDGRVRTGADTRALSGVAKGVNEMIDLLSGLVAQIDENMNVVVGAAQNQLSQAEQLRNTHTQKDAAIRDAKERLDEVAAAITEGRDASSRARQAMRDTQSSSQQGLRAVETAVEAAERMKAASTDALALVASIDEISQQTNLLAVNAGVEAARAGAHGRGFAIVAEEVRTLASRSAELAEQVSDVLRGASERVGDCVSRIDDSSEAFRMVAHSVGFAREAVEDIHATSQRQAELNITLTEALAMIAKYGEEDLLTVNQSAKAAEELTREAHKARAQISAYNSADKPLHRRAG